MRWHSPLAGLQALTLCVARSFRERPRQSSGSVAGRFGGIRMTMRVADAPPRTITSEQAAGLVTSGMWLDYGVALCQPDKFDEALAARADPPSDVKIRTCLTMTPRATIGWV